jgi:hypothetical protein
MALPIRSAVPDHTLSNTKEPNIMATPAVVDTNGTNDTNGIPLAFKCMRLLDPADPLQGGGTVTLFTMQRAWSGFEKAFRPLKVGAITQAVLIMAEVFGYTYTPPLDALKNACPPDHPLRRRDFRNESIVGDAHDLLAASNTTPAQAAAARRVLTTMQTVVTSDTAATKTRGLIHGCRRLEPPTQKTLIFALAQTFSCRYPLTATEAQNRQELEAGGAAVLLEDVKWKFVLREFVLILCAAVFLHAGDDIHRSAHAGILVAVNVQMHACLTSPRLQKKERRGPTATIRLDAPLAPITMAEVRAFRLDGPRAPSPDVFVRMVDMFRLKTCVKAHSKGLRSSDDRVSKLQARIALADTTNPAVLDDLQRRLANAHRCNAQYLTGSGVSRQRVITTSSVTTTNVTTTEEVQARVELGRQRLRRLEAGGQDDLGAVVEAVATTTGRKRPRVPEVVAADAQWLRPVMFRRLANDAADRAVDSDVDDGAAADVAAAMRSVAPHVHTVLAACKARATRQALFFTT